MPGPNDVPPPRRSPAARPAPASGDLRVLRLADLRVPVTFDLRPDPAETARLAATLDLLGLAKVRLAGRAEPARGGVLVQARLGATVTQPCSVTLAPVTTRIDEDVTRRYLAGLAQPDPGSETEMPEDDTVEPLPDQIDLAEVLAEALALALPPFPRAPGAEFGQAVFAAPGVAPMTDADASPFAVLRGRGPARDQDGGQDGGDDGSSTGGSGGDLPG